MRFNVPDCTVQTAGLRAGENSGVYLLPMNDIDWNIDDLQPECAEGTLNIFVEINGDNIVCSGTLDAVFNVPCARCLKPAVFEVTQEIHREYTVNENTPADENVEYVAVRHGKISIIDAIREAVILSIPGKPLCNPDCTGIHYIT